MVINGKLNKNPLDLFFTEKKGGKVSTETDNKVSIKTDVKDILSDVSREICIHDFSIVLHIFKYNSPLYIIGTEWIQKQISTLIKGQVSGPRVWFDYRKIKDCGWFKTIVLYF